MDIGENSGQGQGCQCGLFQSFFGFATLLLKRSKVGHLWAGGGPEKHFSLKKSILNFFAQSVFTQLDC